MSFSFHADTHKKLLVSSPIFDSTTDLPKSSKFLLEAYLDLLQRLKFSGPLTHDLLLTLTNLSHSHFAKSHFASSSDAIPLFLAILSSPQQEIAIRYIASQFFINLTYKYVNAIRALKKPAVVQELSFMQQELLTSIDRIVFQKTSKESIAMRGITGEQKLQTMKRLSENV